MTAGDDKVTIEDPRARFWDGIAARYAEQPIADEAAYRTKLRLTRDYLRGDMEVLEIGCGTGSTALAHAPHVGRILATDISARMIEIARRKAAASGVGNVVFRRAALDDLASCEPRFDAVMALSVLHLLADRDAAIARIYRLLKPGGVFVSNTACLGDTMAWFKLVAPIGRALGRLPLVRVFTIAQLEGSLAAAGFEIAHRRRPGDRHTVFIVALKPG
jgi:SAM-dependent methyltransferase